MDDNIANQIKNKDFRAAKKSINTRLMEKLHDILEAEKSRIGQNFSNKLTKNEE